MPVDASYYDLLGVDRQARQADIRAAYRRLMRSEHPDLGGAGSHELATRLNEAYATLSDAQSRAQYDLERDPMPHLKLPEPSRFAPPSEAYGGYDEGCWDLPDWPR